MTAAPRASRSASAWSARAGAGEPRAWASSTRRVGGAAAGLVGGELGGQRLDLGVGGGAGGLGGGGRRPPVRASRSGAAAIAASSAARSSASRSSATLGVLDDVGLAGAVGVDAGDVAGQARQLGGVGLVLAVQAVLVDGQLVQDGRGDGLGLAQRLDAPPRASAARVVAAAAARAVSSTARMAAAASAPSRSAAAPASVQRA